MKKYVLKLSREAKLLKLIILLIFSHSLVFATQRSPSTYFQLRNDLNKISTKELTHLLNDFVKTSLPSRMVGHPGHEKARGWIQSQIKKIDSKGNGKLDLVNFEPDVEEAVRFYQADFDQKVEGKIGKTDPNYLKWKLFTSSMQTAAKKFKSYKGQNIVWEKAGLNSDKVLVVTAHYDTISHDTETLFIRENDSMPGANYNASGVAIAMGLIKMLTPIELNYSVQVVFLDWQGIGFLGSFKHAQDLKDLKKTVLGVINLEMLGQDTTYFDKNKKLGNMKLYSRSNKDDEKFARQLIAHGQKITSKVEFSHEPNNFENSDNFRYTDLGLTTVTYSQNWEDDFNPKFYQTSQDTPETLNHQTLYQSYQYIGGGVLGTLLEITK